MKKIIKIILYLILIVIVLNILSPEDKKVETDTTVSTDSTTEGSDVVDDSDTQTPDTLVVSNADNPTPASKFREIDVDGENVISGIADPSIEYGESDTGWLTYSRMNFENKDLNYVETHLAKSTDFGKTWQYVSTLNKSTDYIIDSKTQGTWKNETSSLLYDPQDVPDRRWKVFYATFVSPIEKVNGASTFTQNSIRYKYAKSPDGQWSEETCILGLPDSNCNQNFTTLDNSLRDILVFNEIGTIDVGGTIYMSIDISSSETGLGNINEILARKIILIASDNHGRTWRYVGALTDSDDAKSFEYFVFTASSLIREKERLFLMLTPAGATYKKDTDHDGMYIFEFDNIARAELKRDTSGKLVVTKRMGTDVDKGGLGDYHEKNTYGGIIGSNFYVKLFSIRSRAFSTKEGIYW